MQIINKGSGTSAIPSPDKRPIVNITTKPAGNSTFEKLRARLTGSEVSPSRPPKFPSEVRSLQQAQQPKPNFPAQPSGQAPQTPLTTSTSEPGHRAPDESSQAQEAPKSQENPQLSMLARQQRALRKAQQDLKAEQEAWKQEQAKYLSRDTLTSDPLKALAEAGISQDRLVELQLNQSSPPSEVETLKQEIAELKKLVAGVDDKFISRDKQAYDSAIKTITRDAELLVNSDPAYETLKALGSEGSNAVVDLIKKQFAIDGTVLDVEDAAKQIEEVATEREYARVSKLMQLAKIKERLAPKTEEIPVTETNKSQQSSLSQAKTLNNNMGVSRPLTARERAILAFEAAQRNKP